MLISSILMDRSKSLETLAHNDEPFIPLVEEALGTEDIPSDVLRSTHLELVTLTTALCTDTDTRDAGTSSAVRVFCSPDVPYVKRGVTEYSLRLVVSSGRLCNADIGNISIVEIELVEQKEDGPKTYRSVAAMSPSYLSVNTEERAYGHSSELTDLQGFLQTVDFIQARLSAATRSVTT